MCYRGELRCLKAAADEFCFAGGPLRVSLIGGCHADEPVGPWMLRRLVGPSETSYEALRSDVEEARRVAREAVVDLATDGVVYAELRYAPEQHLGAGLALQDVVDAVQDQGADLNHLVPRVLNARGFNYWESGMDFLQKSDYYESYVEYQDRIIQQFDAMTSQFDFHLVDATRNVYDVFADLKKGIHRLIKGMKPASPHVPQKS